MISARNRRHARAVSLFVAAIAALLLTGCTTGASGNPNASSNASGDGSASDVARLVAIGQGRVISLECKGSGSPTVVLISGTGGAADEWMSAVAPTDPQASPYLSTSSVFDVMARTTRVCAYDRPGTTLDSGAPVESTPVPQPTTAQGGVADLRELLTAAHEDGPYVLVGASWGGMIAQLYARTYPQTSSGLVLVDSASVFLKDTCTAPQWANWMAAIQAAHTTSTAEEPDYDPSIAELEAAPVMPPSRPRSSPPIKRGTWP